MKFLSVVNLFFRSLIFSIYTSFTAIFSSIVCLCAWPFPLHYRYKIVSFWTKNTLWMLKKICGIQYEIKGLENIPKDRNGIVLSKHQSTWETFLLPNLFYQTAIILKRELLWLPFFGWGLATIEPIAINRNEKASAMEQVIKKGKECLEKGRWILIFPEGTRIPYGEVGKYRVGGTRLAVSTGYPVIPIAHNAGLFWPRRRFLKKPGTIQVVIGPLISPEGYTPEEMMMVVQNWIEETIKTLPPVPAKVETHP